MPMRPPPRAPKPGPHAPRARFLELDQAVAGREARIALHLAAAPEAGRRRATAGRRARDPARARAHRRDRRARDRARPIPKSAGCCRARNGRRARACRAPEAARRTARRRRDRRRAAVARRQRLGRAGARRPRHPTPSVLRARGEAGDRRAGRRRAAAALRARRARARWRARPGCASSSASATATISARQTAIGVKCRQAGNRSPPIATT